MPLRRFGRPGLIGLAARTAVVAGTATAVQGAAMRHQERRAQSEYEQQQYEAAQQQAQMDDAARTAAAQYAPPASPPPAPADDLIAKLQELGSLKASGVLTEEEFTAAKQKLLG
ncbi:SHOCT domain-containing protein [Microbacterium sp. NRRL B-14842]|uniref:SHOCT domain-containing protein n=1 Tax=unclassified Microbacterium TaxID=2609290 RepID=UPI001656DA5A|nr:MULTISPECIES: SHOCT domain-containing protein [unclassified Microbacterium]MDH5133882.1 SHOCT domain-containing protein [Microbacterium sp. RD10]MDH5137854.1 SHOCT domain-containing protein [Microbacterium sp. RD11]MDH5144814.1 SHOCT domain-containing protein [Microbacterium sp. RD12]MDH5155956.1 SHOCT domain-containing protein [Microbacterium sp. RD06]MDH5165885.1 SHOCT domain-containing protein [Microbacterium sp. RD02]